MVLEFMKISLAVFLVLLELSFIGLIWVGAKTPGTSQGERKWRGINLEKLISEQDGAASFSRFQFLIFTFIVASAYIVYAFQSVQVGKGLPSIDPTVLGLIGISGSSYLISKGIEAGSTDEGKPETKPGTQNWPN